LKCGIDKIFERIQICLELIHSGSNIAKNKKTKQKHVHTYIPKSWIKVVILVLAGFRVEEDKRILN
jgi:hypothetical protein